MASKKRTNLKWVSARSAQRLISVRYWHEGRVGPLVENTKGTRSPALDQLLYQFRLYYYGGACYESVDSALNAMTMQHTDVDVEWEVYVW